MYKQQAGSLCCEDARKLFPTNFVPLCLRVSHFKSPTINDDEGF